MEDKVQEQQDPDKISLTEYLFAPGCETVQVGSNCMLTWAMVMGGTHGSSISCHQMTIYGPSFWGGYSFKADMTLTVISWFSVSEKDWAEPNLYALSGRKEMCAMWLLQKKYGYKPFKVYFTQKKTICTPGFENIGF